MDSFIASQGLRDMVPPAVAAIEEWTGETGSVGIICVDFVESKDIDESTIPAAVATFALKTSPAPFVLIDTPESGGASLMWGDPAGGWSFPSLGASPSGFAYGYRVDGSVEGNFCGCRKFPIPIPITAVGMNVVLGEVRLPVNVTNVFEELPAPG